jgi:cytochrome c biogenesis protein CcdA/peroxiredoxin
VTESDAPRKRSVARTISLSLLGVVILTVAAFAVLNVDRLDRWGASLASVFDGSKPVPLPLALLFVFFAGIVTSLTPCVYPVVPLAVTYLGARSATSRLKAFSLAAVYVAGMVVCYTALGAAAALTGTTFGTATQKWWVYAGVATLVLLFGLSMLGVFNIQLPSWATSFASGRKGPGYKGAFFMGATSGLVTAPCTAPVLGALLPIIARQSVVLGSLLLAVFGLGMGMLFLVVGTYSGVLASLPRSGKWMSWVKIGLGSAILLVAAYFYYQAYLRLPFGGSRPATIGALDLTAGVAPAGIAPALALRADAGLRAADQEKSGDSPARRLAPDFSLIDIKGRRHDLASYRGKTLHLAFLALWCPPCLDQIRRIEMADARLRGRGYRVLAIALKGREEEDDLRSFAADHQIEFPLALDRSGAVASAFSVEGIPTHLIIGPDGAIRYEGRDLPADFERDGAGLLTP